MPTAEHLRRAGDCETGGYGRTCQLREVEDACGSRWRCDRPTPDPVGGSGSTEG
jgi:hypothetical protein